VPISVVKCSWVKCDEVLQCRDVFWLFFIVFIWLSVLYTFVSYVFLLSYLCILIDMYALFCIFFTNWHSAATLTEVFPYFFLTCKANARYTSQRRGTVRTFPN
jgi:hypothetical protein